MKIAIDALSVRGGGGMTYLKQLIFHLWQCDQHNDYYIFVVKGNVQTVINFEDPRFHVIEVTLPRRLLRLVYEQLILPIVLKRLGVAVIYSPAEIAPLPTRCKVVLGIQNQIIYQPEAIDWPLEQRLRFRILRILAWLSVRKARLVIFFSDTSRQYITKRLGLSSSKTRVVWHGVDTRQFHPEKEGVSTDDAPAVSSRISGKYILCVSDIDGHKNHLTLVRAFAALDSSLRTRYRLVLVGRQIHPFYSQVESLVRQLGLDGQVMFTGQLPPDDMPEVYRYASVFVLPSLLETFGLPLIEAMASGVPVIASDASAIPEIVGDAALVFDSHKSSDLSAKLDQLLSNHRLRQQLIEKGLKRARCFSWQTAASIMRDEFQQVAQP